MTNRGLPALSVLDLSPMIAGGTGHRALTNTLDLARHADRLGFTRYWLAEHHNLPNIASAAPDIMIGQVAAVTSRMRVGAGGIMLPNHAPLMVAERFKVLESLFPGRIDLGLGRAPGTDQVTAYALRRRQDTGGDDDFLERFQELVLFGNGGFPEGHPFGRITVMPADVKLPPVWLLGSSDYGAQVAAAVGSGFAFAHHFAHHGAIEAMQTYRARFRPGAWRETPYAILAVHVVCADTDAEAERIAATVDLNFIRRNRGEFKPLASPEEALAELASPEDQARVRQNRARLFVGKPDTVKAQLAPLIAATAADEIMLTAMIYDHDARKRSYELMAAAYGITGAEANADAAPQPAG